jgi:hypothetical protein
VAKRRKRVGPDLSPKELQAGMRLVAPRKRITYLIVRVDSYRIFAKFRKGTAGRYSSKIHEIVPAEIVGWVIEEA